MKLYQINQLYALILDECIDEETGEVLDESLIERLNALEMAFEEKTEDICSSIKNLLADADAIKLEEKNLKKRREAKEHLAERLTEYLKQNLNGRPYESARHKVKYTHSESLEVDLEKFRMNENAAMYLKPQEPVPDKMAIKKAMKDGKVFDGVQIIEKNNIKIK